MRILIVLLLASASVSARPRQPFLVRQRANLEQARVDLASSVSRRASPVRALQQYTRSVDGLLRRVDRQVVCEIGKPPTDPTTSKPVAYEVFAMGSYGRRELAPFSDLDYGILTGASSPQIRGYFARYGQRVDTLLRAIDGQGRLKPCDGMSPSGTYGDMLVDTVDRMTTRAVGQSRSLAARPPRERDYIQAALSSTRPVLRRGQAGLHRRFLRDMRARVARDSGPLIERLLPSLRDPFGLPVAATDPAWARGLAAPVAKDPRHGAPAQTAATIGRNGALKERQTAMAGPVAPPSCHHGA